MDRRKTDRVVVDLDIGISLGGRPQQVHLYDLSMDGCMIEAIGASWSEGEPVVIELDGIAMRGSLIWTRGPCAGVLFAERLDEAIVARLDFKGAEQLASDPFADQFGRQLSSRAHRNMHLKLA